MDQIAVELMAAQDRIKDLCRRIKNNAESIKKEMDYIIDFADAITKNPNDALHFQVDVHNRTDWKNLPIEITEANARIQEHQSLRRVIREIERKAG